MLTLELVQEYHSLVSLLYMYLKGKILCEYYFLQFLRLEEKMQSYVLNLAMVITIQGQSQ